MMETHMTVFNRLLDIGKTMKIKDNDYIFLSLDDNMIYTIDSISVKYTDISNDETLMFLKVFNYKGFNNTIYLYKILKEIIKSNFNPIYNNIFVDGIGIIGDINNITTYEASMTINTIKSNIIKLKQNLSDSSICLTLNDVQNNPDFKAIMDLKSADGAEKFIIDNHHIITLFNGLLPILKSDKVNIYIRDYLLFFNVDFEIIKKKHNVHINMSCLYL